MATQTLSLTDRRSAQAVGVIFTVAGSLHFITPSTYESIMPPYLPAHRELVLLSGAAEIAGGLATLFPQTHRFARWWLLALLVAVFPANVYMATNLDDIKGLPDLPAWTVWARLPLQALFMAAVVWATRPKD